jgi:hypothetical protein
VVKAVEERSGRGAAVATLPFVVAANLKAACCAALGIEPEEHALMAYPGQRGEPQALEPNLGKTLLGLRLGDRQALLLRRKDHPQQQRAGAAARAGGAAAAAALKIATATPLGGAAAGGGGAAGFGPMSVGDGGGGGGGGGGGSLGLGAGLPLASSPAGGSFSSPRVLHLGSSPVPMSSSSPLSRSFSLAPSWAEDTIVPVRPRLCSGCCSSASLLCGWVCVVACTRPSGWRFLPAGSPRRRRRRRRRPPAGGLAWRGWVTWATPAS